MTSIPKLFRKVRRTMNRKLLRNSEKKALQGYVKALNERDFAAARQVAVSPEMISNLSDLCLSHTGLTGLLDILEGSMNRRRILMRPHNVAGYLSHYHHFFGGVILPLLEWASVGVFKDKADLVVRDCGPMNTELEQWANLCGIRLAVIPQVLIEPLAKSGLLEVLDSPGYDFCYREDWYPRELVVDGIRRHVFGIIESDLQESKLPGPKTVLIVRGKSNPFYGSKASETAASGAKRRSIPNLTALTEAMREVTPNLHVVYLEEMTVVEKVRMFRDTDIVVGQMGAGLNNILWMPPGAALIEILSLDTIRRDFSAYANISHRMKVRHRRVIQESDHSEVPIPLLLDFLREFAS